MKKIIIPTFLFYVYLFHYKDGKINIDTTKIYKNDNGKITINISPITSNINKLIIEINKRCSK